MNETNNAAGSNRRPKKPGKIINLLDFVVIKKKCPKTQKEIYKKISAKKPQKKGKVKRKKPTTIKKKILKERLQKKENDLKVIEEIVEEISAVKLEDLPEEIEKVVSAHHSRNFREYCDHLITQEIRDYCETAIKDLFRYQENKFQQNPIKAKANRRYVVGFKEVRKFLVVEKLKLIFIAPDLERNLEVDKLVDEIKNLAIEHKTPYVFGLKRRKLGYLLLKKVPVSIVGIFDYQGTTENVNNLLSHVDSERINYKNKSL